MDIKEYKIPKILFIKGTFIKDCIPVDELFEQKIMEQLNHETPVIQYNKIPSNFTDLKSWIKKTNIKCWHCDLNFDNIPVFIPKLIEPSTAISGYNIGTYGCFCSFSCAEAFNNLHNSRICDNIRVKEMIRFLYKIFNRYHVKEIYPSPSKYEMIQYGGNIDPILYKQKINKLKKKTELMEIKS